MPSIRRPDTPVPVIEAMEGRQDKERRLDLVLKYVPLPVLAAGPERPRLAAARHSENWYDFSGLQSGPVKGMTF